MADNLFERDVQTGIEMAWHNKTRVVEIVTKENSGICYPMEKRNLFRKTFKENEEVFVPSKNFEIVSLDDNLPVGKAVSETYTLIQNSQLWEMVHNALAGTSFKVVSCGTVCNREKVFISVKVSDDFKAANRLTQSVLNIISGHGGKLAVMAKSGLIVVVCYNTLMAALNEKSEFLFRVRHTKKANLELTNMGEAIEKHMGVAKEFSIAMDEIAQNKCNSERAERIYSGFLTPVDDKAMSTRTKNVVSRITTLFANGRGNSGSNESDLFNGLTDYFTHESAGENNWKQFVSSEFGTGGTRKVEFYNLLRNRERLAQVEKRGDSLLTVN